MEKYKIKFLPVDRICFSENGVTVLETAMKSGIHINASCGGNASCGKCRIRVLDGDAPAAPHASITESEYDAGVRLACMTIPKTDITVEIPLESQVDKLALKNRKNETSILSVSDIGEFVTGWEVDPAVFKKYIECEPPSIEDNISDLSRIMRMLKTELGVDEISVDFRILENLGIMLRTADWKITVTIARMGERYKLVHVEPGNTEKNNYSVVIDIGTTTVCTQLLDLANCSVLKLKSPVDTKRDFCTLGEASNYNAQISYGEDVISRIMYARKEKGLNKLREVLLETINNLIKELIKISGISEEHISHIVCAGNTVMTHIFLNLNPEYIMLSPYVPTATFYPSVRASELGINLKSHVYVYVFPCVASYVGGDIVSGVLGSGIFQSDRVNLFMDIGTNGEIVLGNKDWFVCASCSAGPAFEGGGIKFGMRAGKGAIEQIRINPITFEPMVLTIGRTNPSGICGSGLIDLVAELIKVGLLARNGKFKWEIDTERIRQGDSGYEYVICYANETMVERDIVITEVDIENLMRAKAAIYAGCKVLLDNVGLAFKDVDMVIISGGFGHYIDLEKARIIGLLPGLPSNKFIFAGNGSLLGARLVSFCRAFLSEAESIAKTMVNIELSNNNKFMDEYIAAMFLPHTNFEEFPDIVEKPENFVDIE